MTDKTHSDRSTSEVVQDDQLDRPLIRAKSLSAVNEGGMRTVIDFGDAGSFVTDEPIAHGGTNEGPSPLQAVVGALCGCESVTFHRTAEERDFAYRRITFDADSDRHPRANGPCRRSAALSDRARRGRRRDERGRGRTRAGR